MEGKKQISEHPYSKNNTDNDKDFFFLSLKVLKEMMR